MDIREASELDCRALARLVLQLGYERSESELKDGLKSYSGTPDRVFVAEADGVVVGLVVLNVLQPFHVTAPWGRVSALVVDESFRGSGIGEILLDTANSYFRSIGCSKYELTSGEHRVDAHRFYRRNGFEEKPKRFVREIGN